MSERARAAWTEALVEGEQVASEDKGGNLRWVCPTLVTFLLGAGALFYARQANRISGRA